MSGILSGRTNNCRPTPCNTRQATAIVYHHHHYLQSCAVSVPSVVHHQTIRNIMMMMLIIQVLCQLACATMILPTLGSPSACNNSVLTRVCDMAGCQVSSHYQPRSLCPHIFLFTTTYASLPQINASDFNCTFRHDSFL